MIRILVLSMMIGLAVQAVQKERPATVGKVHGRITERETGKPVGGLRVGLVRKSYSLDGVLEPRLSTSAKTDANGAYTIVTTPGRYYVTTSAQASDGIVFSPQYFPATSA